MLRTLLLVVALSAPTAMALDLPDGHSSGGGGCDSSCGVAAGVTLGITFGLDLIIDIVDLAIVLPGGFLSPGWGIVQALWGVAHVVLGGIFTGVGLLGVALQSEGAGGLLAAGLPMLGEGILLIVIAVISGVRFVADRRREIEERRHPAVPIMSFSIDPRGGASAQLAWTF